MTSIPPTERICEAISEFLTKGISDGQNVTNTLFLLGAQRLIQELLEQEATDYLGRVIGHVKISINGHEN